MGKDINRIKVVLAEKGGAARLPGVSWRASTALFCEINPYTNFF